MTKSLLNCFWLVMDATRNIIMLRKLLLSLRFCKVLVFRGKTDKSYVERFQVTFMILSIIFINIFSVTYCKAFFK